MGPIASAVMQSIEVTGALRSARIAPPAEQWYDHLDLQSALRFHRDELRERSTSITWRRLRLHWGYSLPRCARACEAATQYIHDLKHAHG